MRPLFFLLRLKLTVIFTIVIFNLSAQEYFNRIIPTEFGNVNTGSINHFSESFIITGIFGNEENNTASVLIKVNGNSYDYNIYNEFGFAGGPLAIYDDNISFLAKDRKISKGTFVGTLDPFLDLIKVDTLESPGEQDFPGNMHQIDNSIFASIIITEDGKRKILISKYDVNKGHIWTKRYEENISYSYIWHFNNAKENHVLASYTMSFNDIIGRNGYVMKIDTSGDVVWRSDPLELIDGGAAPIAIAELSNGNTIATYRKDMWDSFEFLFCFHPRPPTFVWLDSEGQFIKEHTFKIIHYDEMSFSNVKAGKGDYFFAYGRYSISDGVSANEYSGFITKYTNEGDTIWSNRYRHAEYDSSRISHNVKDIIELENGDIVAMGNVNPIGEKNQVWYFKVDENGCFDADNCDGEVQILTDTKEVEQQPITIALYPNPAKDHIKLERSDNQLITSVLIISMDGERKISPVKDSNLDISDYAAGVYTLTITLEDGEVINKRFVKME